MRRALRSTRGKLALSAVSLLVLAIAGTAVFSAFSSTQGTGSNTFAAGSVALATDGTGSVLFNASNMTPGDSLTKCVSVTYSGTLGADVSMFGTESGSLAADLDVTVTHGLDSGNGGGVPASPANSCANFRADSGGLNGVIFNSTLSAFPGSANAIADPTNPWTSATTAVYEITVALDPTSTDQSGTASAVFTWQAKQLS